MKRTLCQTAIGCVIGLTVSAIIRTSAVAMSPIYSAMIAASPLLLPPGVRVTSYGLCAAG